MHRHTLCLQVTNQHVLGLSCLNLIKLSPHKLRNEVGDRQVSGAVAEGKSMEINSIFPTAPHLCTERKPISFLSQPEIELNYTTHNLEIRSQELHKRKEHVRNEGGKNRAKDTVLYFLKLGEQAPSLYYYIHSGKSKNRKQGAAIHYSTENMRGGGGTSDKVQNRD